MYAYAAAGLLLGLLVSFGYAPLLLPLLLGVVCIVAGTALAARPGLVPSVLLVVGGILVGGMIVLAAAAWEVGDPAGLAVAFGFGALLLGWPPTAVAGSLDAERRRADDE